MSTATIGIDFGTTTSSMAWVDPATGKAEVLMNAEGELKTPSVAYFGADATLVGTHAEQMLDEEDETERRRVVTSIKRELVNAPTLALPGRRVKAVEVAAAVLAKLKRDAEELHFRAPVTRAVVTCPAAFDALERDAIAQAARLAGFAEVELLDEPVAAALAYSRAGQAVGRHVLVYDLGGGTFDLALLRESEDGFELAMEPKGLRRCGGDDFDAALYDWCDAEAQRESGEPLDATGRNRKFLRDCRKRKENLSVHDKARFSSLVRPGRFFRHELTRAVFEDLIRERVDFTVRLTAELARAASTQGCAVETLVLIGGSARIPLIRRALEEALGMEARRTQYADVAVALGAAYVAARIWAPRPVPPPDDRPERLARYRAAVSEAGSGETLDAAAVARLAALAEALRLDAEAAGAIEREALGETKEARLARSQQRDRHRRPSVPRVQDLHGQSAEVVQRLQRETAAALGVEVVFRHRLQDGGEGPELVVIPPGRFRMGSPEREPERFEDEGPQHPVTLARPFAIGCFAVTFEEYDRFCTKTGRDKPSDSGWGRGRRPVINVSWVDAVAYCVWLSQQTGKSYRLPSEAEWEYAARAGTTTAFWWGDRIDPSLANYDGNFTYADGPEGEYRQRTLPVDSFQPNPFGLYQVHGNVWEWCQDQWHGGYAGAPADGSAWERGGGALPNSGGFFKSLVSVFTGEGDTAVSRVLRGGSWRGNPEGCRAAYRRPLRRR